MGACDIGPVFKIKDTVYGNLDREKVHSIIAELRASVKEAK
jgi:NADH-quinone oxidoreductase subunit E